MTILPRARNSTIRRAGLGLKPAASSTHGIVTRRRCWPMAKCSPRQDFRLSPNGELYDPASGTWTETGSLATGRLSHTATLLADGKLLVVGGIDSSCFCAALASAELYDVGLGFRSDWQPEIDRAPRKLLAGNRLILKGSRFQGISQASGGAFQDSSTNYPIVQLRCLDNSQVAFLPVDPVRGWSDTRFRSVPVRDFPLGPALVTVFTNGIPSEAKSVVLTTSQQF